MPVFFLIGNTTLKASCANDAFAAFPADVTAGELADFLADFSGEPSAAASVNPAAQATLEDACLEAGLAPPLYVGHDFPAGVELAVPCPSRVGIDRILNVKAAFGRCGRSCAAVDFGTAVSVSVADSSGRFVGGAILPGLGLAFRCLHEATAFLPEVPAAVPPSPLGPDTLSAIQSGVLYGTLGAVKEILARICGVLGGDIEVFLTGGDCELMARISPDNWRLAPALTLEGLRLAYDENR